MEPLRPQRDTTGGYVSGYQLLRNARWWWYLGTPYGALNLYRLMRVRFAGEAVSIVVAETGVVDFGSARPVSRPTYRPRRQRGPRAASTGPHRPGVSARRAYSTRMEEWS